MWSDANWCGVTVVHVWLHTRSVHQRSDEWSSCGSVPPWHGVTQVGPEQGFSGCEWAAAILVSAPGIRLWNHVLTKSLSVAARIALFKDVTVNKLISMDTVNREASFTVVVFAGQIRDGAGCQWSQLRFGVGQAAGGVLSGWAVIY